MEGQGREKLSYNNSLLGDSGLEADLMTNLDSQEKGAVRKPPTSKRIVGLCSA